MKKFSSGKIKFEGLYLSEVVECNFMKLNHTLVLEVKPKKKTQEYLVVSGTYRKRNDGHFSLDVIFPIPAEGGQNEEVQ